MSCHAERGTAQPGTDTCRRGGRGEFLTAMYEVLYSMRAMRYVICSLKGGLIPFHSISSIPHSVIKS